jgi:hypothetical protein
MEKHRLSMGHLISIWLSKTSRFSIMRSKDQTHQWAACYNLNVLRRLKKAVWLSVLSLKLRSCSLRVKSWRLKRGWLKRTKVCQVHGNTISNFSKSSLARSIRIKPSIVGQTHSKKRRLNHNVSWFRSSTRSLFRIIILQVVLPQLFINSVR